MPAESSRTAEEKKQEHIDAIKERITEDIGPVIEESIQRSIQDYTVTRIAPNGNDDSQARHQQAIEKFRSLIPRPTFDQLWTERDEQKLIQEVDKDAEFQHCCTYQDYISATWKTAYKFMGCLATDIVGPKTYLAFHDDHAASKTRFWPTRFCRKLSSLIVQPVFAANPAKLALAIQWTVICRTGDQRKWRLSGCMDDDEEFLRALTTVIRRAQDGTKGPGQLREMARDFIRRKYISRGGDDPLWCQFLQRIEEKAPVSTHVAEQGRDSQDVGDFEPYRVCTTDLANLLDAIREVRVNGFPMFHDPTTVAMTLLYTRDAADLPLRPQVMEATRAVLLSHRRELKRTQKLSMLDNRGSSAPSQSGAAQGDVDEERDLGHPLDAGLNRPDEHLDEAMAQADDARKAAEEQAKEVDRMNEQAAVPEMDQNSQEAARGSRTGGVSSAGGEVENACKNEQPEDVRPTPPSPARAMPGRPRLDQPDTAANAQNNQNNVQAAQQEYATAREQQEQQQQVPFGLLGSRFNTYKPFFGKIRGGTVRQDRAGRQGSSGHPGQDGQQARATVPNDANVEQPATRAVQQILGKRRRESDTVESAGEFKMPYFTPDEVTVDMDANGNPIRITPIDPHADASNMVVRYPSGMMRFQLQPLTPRGREVTERLCAEVPMGYKLILTPEPVEDFGLGNNLDRVGVSTQGLPSQPLQLPWMVGQNQNRPQNQIQGPAQPNRNQAAQE